MRETRNKLILTTAAALLCVGTAHAQAPVQVYILAGQSNMEGKGQVEGPNGTLRDLITDDITGNTLAQYAGIGLVDASDNWVTRDDVYIYSTTDGGEGGGLTVGYGSNSFIGPELGFGTVIGNQSAQDVLIIKTAWGGRSLGADFRPPTAVQQRGGEVGYAYNDMLNEIDSVLGDIGAHVPGYAGQGYELKGFGWHQGWNDRINQTFVNEYEANLVDLINDVRFELGAADLPFVVANTGIGGPSESNARALQLMQAQLNVGNPALYPAFDGNVKAIDTRPMWIDAADSPVPSGSQGFHWNQSGETMYLMGEEMGVQMATMSDYVQFERQYLEVNQQTGEITIINPATNLDDLDLEAYSITSASGALSATNWTSIAGNYDGAGDGSVDSGNWAIDTASVNELSESAVPGGDDGSIATGSDISLGAGAWIQNLNKDLQATYTDTDGNVENLYILYTGSENILADLNTDGSIDLADWTKFVAGIQVDMTGLSAPQAYQLGDLDGDMDNDIDDFDRFRRAYELNNPQAGAFEAMLAEASVPEPSSLALLAMAGAGLLSRRRQA